MDVARDPGEQTADVTSSDQRTGTIGGMASQ
jgi:hypothetical protein